MPTPKLKVIEYKSENRDKDEHGHSPLKYAAVTVKYRVGKRMQEDTIMLRLNHRGELVIQTSGAILDFSIRNHDSVAVGLRWSP
jgi:hypothetical protein